MTTAEPSDPLLTYRFINYNDQHTTMLPSTPKKLSTFESTENRLYLAWQLQTCTR